MAFERKPFDFEEEHLYAALSPEDRNMGYGAVGHVRAELQWYDFQHMWCPERKILDTSAFRRELKDLLRALQRGVFKSEPALSEFSPTVRPVQIFGDFDIRFKVESENYSYFVHCRPMERGYDITIRAYDNSFLLPELAGLHKLPEKCYSVHEGELVLLQRGQHPYMLRIDTDGDLRDMANGLNADLGVTKAQEAAMRMGCLYGFNESCAWPWQYDKNGEPRKFETPKQDKGAR